MYFKVSTIALIAGLSFAGLASAQDAPAGGPTAKGNAPLKTPHTVNDGAAKQGANSFTQNEARKHIINSGYSSVSSLAKGSDGVWRGTAAKGGITYNVALDFKGNVSDGGAVGPAGTPSSSNTTATSAMSNNRSDGGQRSSKANDRSGPAPSNQASSGTMHHHHHARHRHHWMHSKSCMVHGAACSGADRNQDGIADKDEHKAKP